MNTVWVVEQGDYSDYRVVGVFSTETNARMICDAINRPEYHGYEATVAEWPLDPAIDALSKGLKQYRVSMERDGRVTHNQLFAEFDANQLTSEPFIWRRSQAAAYRGQNLSDLMQVTVFARNEKHAVKIANEKRRQMIALGRWTEK